MKKTFLILSIVICSVALKAQPGGTISLNGYGSYTFDDKVYFDNAYAKVAGAFQYGGGLEFYLHESRSIELKYLRMDTNIPLYSSAGLQQNTNHDTGAVSYVLVGGNNYFGMNPDAKAVPFAGVDLGVGILNGEGSSATKFAWGVKVGVKIKTSSAVSFKLHAYIQSIVSTFGEEYWNTGWGVYAVPNYVSLYQLGLGGAICFDFRKK
jgi:hypothetical protein